MLKVTKCTCTFAHNFSLVLGTFHYMTVLDNNKSLYHVAIAKLHSLRPVFASIIIFSL